MKIVADSAIPFLQGVLEPWAEVRYLPGSPDRRGGRARCRRPHHPHPHPLRRAPARRFARPSDRHGDHRVRPHRHGVVRGARHTASATAAGCNARGVLQWAGAVLAHLARTQGWQPAERTLGVVGVGTRRVARTGVRRIMGLPRRLLRPAARGARTLRRFVPLEEVARASRPASRFHTPLDATTRRMAGEALFARLKPGAVVMNSSRGEVVDGDALLRSGHPCVLDVWEHEPAPRPRGCSTARVLATPHVAGYSEQGKATATAMSVATLAGFFGLPLPGFVPLRSRPSGPAADPVAGALHDHRRRL